MSVARMWNQVKTPPGWSMASFNLHSAGVAILSDLLAQKLPVDYAEGAFAAGLFHDLGWLLVALSCPEVFQQASSASQQAGPGLAAGESEILGISHAELSAQALASWNLPEPIQNAVRYHAKPEEDPGAGSARFALSRIVSAADQCVRRMGCPLSLIENDQEISAELPHSLSEQLAEILPAFEDEFSSIKQYF